MELTNRFLEPTNKKPSCHWGSIAGNHQERTSLIQLSGSNNYILGKDSVHNGLVPVVLIKTANQVDTRMNDPAVLKVLPMCCVL